ncbi:MAG: flagellar export protein FliJ [Lentisphaerae bacterium RIFOXYA12_FULL_48_11]|nr:MAG: flagellar export protein FliJ [Lentisphaerae bacterium RIFOXYA12_FULL_48_11]
MKNFSFSLQRLLDAKEALEKAAEVRVGEMQRKLNHGEARLARLREQEHLQERSHADKLRGGELNRHDMSVRVLFVNRFEGHMSKQEEVVRKYRQSLEEARTLLLTAMRERKSLEKLKEREKSQWITDGRRADRREMDEMAIARFVRQERIA